MVYNFFIGNETVIYSFVGGGGGAFRKNGFGIVQSVIFDKINHSPKRKFLRVCVIFSNTIEIIQDLVSRRSPNAH